MHKIYMIMGKSATGKDTIYKELQRQKRIPFGTVIGYTTRPIRTGEQDGVEYYFVGKEELLRLQREDKVIEHRAYQTLHGIWNYFTVNDGQIDLEQNNYIMIGTLETYEQVKKYFGDQMVEAIYLEAEDEIRLRRSIDRESRQKNPKYAELCRRYLADETDFSEENIRRAGIEKRYLNTDIVQCCERILADISMN